jgi:hypothetical protein
MYATLILVICRQPKQLEWIRLHTERRLDDVRDLEIRISLNPAGREYRLHAAI